MAALWNALGPKIARIARVGRRPLRESRPTRVCRMSGTRTGLKETLDLKTCSVNVKHVNNSLISEVKRENSTDLEWGAAPQSIAGAFEFFRPIFSS